MQALLWIHIIGAAIWFGGGVATHFGDRVLGRESDAVRAGWYRLVLAYGQRLYTPAAIVILLTGIFLVTGNAQFEFSSAFVSIGFVTVIIGGILGGTVFGPQARIASQAFDGGDPNVAEAAVSRIRTASMGETALLAFTMAAMVWKF